MIHELKISSKYFDDVRNDTKTFEVRKNDRPFAVGDMLVLREYDDGEYTGRSTTKYISYILDDPQYCVEGYVILGLGFVLCREHIEELETRLNCEPTMTFHVSQREMWRYTELCLIYGAERIERIFNEVLSRTVRQIPEMLEGEQ